MKDKLLSLPYEDLAVIINDYELANSYQPVYTSTACNLSNLLNEGKVVSKPFILNDFAFLTVNRYNQIEPIADITKFIDFDNDLVPFVEQNKTRYACLSSLEDSKAIHDELLDPAWLEKKWAEIKKFGGRKDQKLETLASEVEAIDLRFGYKIREVENKYLNGQYSFKEALQAIKKLFEENVKSGKELNTKANPVAYLKSLAVKKYKALTKEDLHKYEHLPNSWREIIDPLIKNKYYKKAEEEINRLSLSEKDKANKNKEGKNNDPSDLAYLTNLYFNCKPDDKEGLIKYGKENYVDDIKQFLKTLIIAFNDFLKNKITYEYLENYIKGISKNIENYQKYKNYEPTKNQIAENKERIQTERNIDKEVQEHVDTFRNNKKKMELFNKYYKPLKQKFLAGDFTQNQYEDLLVILINKCKGNPKTKEYKEAVEAFIKLSDNKLPNDYILKIEQEVEDGSLDNSKKIQNRFPLIVFAMKEKEALDIIVRQIQTMTPSLFLSVVENLSIDYSSSQVLEYFKNYKTEEQKKKEAAEKAKAKSNSSQNQTQN